LAQLVAALMADASVGLVAPRLVHEGGQLQHSVYRFPSPRLTALICGTPLWVQRGAIARHWWLEGRVPHTRASDVDWAIGAVHVMRTAALPAQPPYGEHWFMYVEDLDLCWRLRQAGWRVRFDPAVEVVHTGNVAGAMAWGDTRTIRWWAATYDWYRRAHGVAAARRYARVNVTGVRFMLWRARVRRRLSNAAAEAALTAQVEEFRAILPIHQEMARQPDTAFAAEVRAAPSAL
jgi:GT2 family glycosyltransferase